VAVDFAKFFPLVLFSSNFPIFHSIAALILPFGPFVAAAISPKSLLHPPLTSSSQL
jgi:hypothetical protein